MKSKIKKKLLISFSGGETSAYMAIWLWLNKRDEYDMIFVFANTGQENEETLKFVRDCELYFGFPVIWVEAHVLHGKRKSTSFKIVNYKTASRDGEPFEEVIKKYGIPNKSFPHCTRELKTNPIHSYVRSLGWEDYYTAIGIRLDEMDRMSVKREELKFYYPLVSERPMTKKKINFWWSQQPFRLELKGYQGNCITCWKKSDNKLYTIAKENPKNFNFMGKMELRYGKFIPKSRLILMDKRGELPVYPITFFRSNRSAIQIVKESEKFDKIITNDSDQYDDSESCEVHSECGIDN